MESLNFLLGFLFGCVVGGIALLNFIKAMVSHSKTKPTNHTLTTERAGETILLYHDTTFLCQGQSIDEVITKLTEMYSNLTARVMHDEQYIEILNGKVQ